MPIKMTVTGKPTSVKTVSYQGTDIVCLDFEEGGSPSAPKGLPTASKITTTVLLNQKQWRALNQSIEAAGDTFETVHKLFIQGELTVDLPMDIVEGELGVIAFQAQYLPKKENEKENTEGEVLNKDDSLEEKKLDILEEKNLTQIEGNNVVLQVNNENEPNNKNKSNSNKNKRTGTKKKKTLTVQNQSYVVVNAFELLMKKVQIPDSFLLYKPRQEKVENNIEYYRKHGEFNGEIVVIKDGKNWLLMDGYAKYVAAKQLELEKIHVVAVENPLEEKELVQS